jgi:hypothetical protein
MIGEAGYEAGLKQRSKLERLGWAWKGAHLRELREQRLNPIQAVNAARGTVNDLADKLQQSKCSRRDVVVALVFAKPDNVGKLEKPIEFFYVDDPESVSKDLDIARNHLQHVPVGFIVAVLKRKQKEIIVHARPLIVKKASLALLERLVEEAAKDERWWVN